MLSFFKKLFGGDKKSSCCGGACSTGLDHKKLLNITDADIQELKKQDPKLVVGKVLKVEDHPNPKMTKVRVATVQIDGRGTEETICCGGTNLAEGQIVAAATVGTILPGDFEIGVRDLRGVESRGMICARKELGITCEEEGPKEIWPIDGAYEAKLGESLCNVVV